MEQKIDQFELVPDEISEDGLRYKTSSKTQGSPFEQRNSETIRSCFLCGQHKSIQNGLFRKFLGKQHFVCNICCGTHQKKNEGNK